MPAAAYPTNYARATVDVLAEAMRAAAERNTSGNGNGNGIGKNGMPSLLPRAESSSSSSVDILPTGVSSIDGQPSPTSTSSSDPLLALMPDFAFSMPAQVVVNGVNLALVAILTIHLLFTIHYHFPLSKRNYSLQIGSSLMLLISVSVQIHAIFDILKQKSMIWPYMFSYIGIQIPPQDGSWTEVQRVFYLLMRAITTALVHLTHIQFLTLLFPSALEARLIFWMLGPLALAASGMEFTSLSPNDDLKTSDLGDSIRNICNSTLTLLYTVALLIWGLAVNRQRAWRTDGGTASFGAGSVGLALLNTAISFVEIAYDRLWWLPDICWTLTIWQSWLGFWWWVGAGMGIGEVEDRAERVAKKRKREERRRRKLEKAERLKKKLETGESGETSFVNGGDSDVLEGMRRFTGRIVGGIGSNSSNDGSGILNRRRNRNNQGEGDGNDGSEDQRNGPHDDSLRSQANGQIEREGGDEVGVQNRSATTESRNRRTDSQNPTDETGALESIAVVGDRNDGPSNERRARNQENPPGPVNNRQGSGPEITATAATDDGLTVAGSSNSNSTNPTETGLSSSQTSSGGSGFIDSFMRTVIAHQPDFIRRRMKRLRLEHVAAARVAAGEQAALREQVMNLGRGRDNGPGLRSMMMGNGRDENGETSSSQNQSTSHGKLRDSLTTNGNGAAGGGNHQQIGTSSPTSHHPRLRSLNNGHQSDRNSSSSQNRGHHPSFSLRTNETGESSSGHDVLTGTTALESGNNSSNQNHTSSDDREGSPERAIGRIQTQEDEDEDAWVEEEEEGDEGGAETAVPNNESNTIRNRNRNSNRSQDASRRESEVRSTRRPERNQDDRDRDQPPEIQPEQDANRSWYWRGGLRRARLRDRQTYD